MPVLKTMRGEDGLLITLASTSSRLDDACIDELHDLITNSRVLHVILQSAWIGLCLL